MSRYGTSGNLAVRFCPTIVDMQAPTVAEVTAGVDLSMYVLRDGLKTPATANTVDASVVGSAFTPQAPGTYGGDALTMTCQRGSKGGADGDDVAWSTFVRNTPGYVVVARTGWGQSTTTGLGDPENDPTADDRVEVYPVMVASRAMADIAENQTSRFDATLTISADPALDATIAAGV